MIIRYIAQTDDSSIGYTAFEYLKGLLRLAPVRLFSFGGALGGTLDGRWVAFTPLLLTPLPLGKRTLVNVVCCAPDRWTWLQSVAMPNLDQQGNVVSTEHAQERVELYTAGVRNVLLATCTPPSLEHLKTAQKYEAIVVPSGDLQSQWQRMLPVDRAIATVPHFNPTVIPVPVVGHAALRSVIFPQES